MKKVILLLLCFPLVACNEDTQSSSVEHYQNKFGHWECTSGCKEDVSTEENFNGRAILLSINSDGTKGKLYQGND